jgi:hypothetical protein
MDNGTFQPSAPITRAQFIAIAMRFAKSDAGAESSFSDVSENAWYCAYVSGASRYGWVSGYSDGGFHPNEPITRAEVTVILNRMLGRTVDQNPSGETKFSDVPSGYWAYADILEATGA